MNIIKRYNSMRITEENFKLKGPSFISSLGTMLFEEPDSNPFDITALCMSKFTCQGRDYVPGDIIFMSYSRYDQYSSAIGLDQKVVIIHDNNRREAV